MGRTVYEAKNESLKEFFIGSTAFPVESVKTAHRTIPPAAISHWKQGRDQIEYRELERDLADLDVAPFIETYARSILREGWRVIVEKSASAE